MTKSREQRKQECREFYEPYTKNWKPELVDAEWQEKTGIPANQTGSNYEARKEFVFDKWLDELVADD